MHISSISLARLLVMRICVMSVVAGVTLLGLLPLSHSQGKLLTPVSLLHLASHARPHPLAAASCDGPGSYSGGTWADNEAVAPGCKRGIYNTAELEFHVPTISTANSSAQVAFWVGVGGDSYVTPNNVLVQAGVKISVVNGHQYNQSVWEVVNGQEPFTPYSFAPQNLPLCRLAAGDQVYMYVQDLNGWDYFFMENFSDNNCSNYCELDTTGTRVGQGACAGVPGKTYYNSDGASGECVAEQIFNYSTSTPIPLAEWTGTAGEGVNNIQFQDCQVNSKYINAQTHSHSDITNKNGTPLTHVGSLDNYGDFTISWRAGN